MRPRRDADHSPHSSAAVMEEYCYTSTHPLGHTGPVTGTLPFLYQTYVVFGGHLLVLYIRAIQRDESLS